MERIQYGGFALVTLPQPEFDAYLRGIEVGFVVNALVMAKTNVGQFEEHTMMFGTILKSNITQYYLIAEFYGYNVEVGNQVVEEGQEQDLTKYCSIVFTKKPPEVKGKPKLTIVK